MCGLAHYVEEGGIPTVIISLVKKHTEVMKPPRALHVPFELGRPFGDANKPNFQRKVLLTALKLLERNDGPVLETFNENVTDFYVLIGPSIQSCCFEIMDDVLDSFDSKFYTSIKKNKYRVDLQAWAVYQLIKFGFSEE